MKIVIDIPEEVYERASIIELDSTYEEEYLLQIILDGTPLPKGHGRLIDADDFFCEYPELAKEPYIHAPTVIEADKAESDAPNFESEEYVEERIENYDKMLKSGILDCVKEKSQESEGKE